MNFTGSGLLMLRGTDFERPLFNLSEQQATKFFNSINHIKLFHFNMLLTEEVVIVLPLEIAIHFENDEDSQ